MCFFGAGIASTRTRLFRVNQTPLLHADLTSSIISAFYAVYSELGFGFLEQAYAKALEVELRLRGHNAAREYGARVWYKGHDLGTYRLDLVVDEAVVVEVKSARALHETAERQLTNYLKASNLEVGLLLHFGPRPSFRRVIFTNDYSSRVSFAGRCAPGPSAREAPATRSSMPPSPG